MFQEQQKILKAAKNKKDSEAMTQRNEDYLKNILKSNNDATSSSASADSLTQLKNNDATSSSASADSLTQLKNNDATSSSASADSLTQLRNNDKRPFEGLQSIRRNKRSHREIIPHINCSCGDIMCKLVDNNKKSCDSKACRNELVASCKWLKCLKCQFKKSKYNMKEIII